MIGRVNNASMGQTDYGVQYDDDLSESSCTFVQKHKNMWANIRYPISDIRYPNHITRRITHHIFMFVNTVTILHDERAIEHVRVCVVDRCTILRNLVPEVYFDGLRCVWALIHCGDVLDFCVVGGTDAQIRRGHLG